MWVYNRHIAHEAPECCGEHQITCPFLNHRNNKVPHTNAANGTQCFDLFSLPQKPSTKKSLKSEGKPKKKMIKIENLSYLPTI